MSAPLSIVHMIPALTKGGAERVAVDLANASTRAGHSTTVVAGWKVAEQILRVRLDPGVHVIYMTQRVGSKFQRYWAGLKWVLENRKWLATHDVVHVHLTQASVFGTILFTLRNLSGDSRPAIVETYHCVGMKIPDYERAFHAWNCRRRDGLAVMALDPYWRDFMGRSPTRVVEMIPNGVDTPVGPAPPGCVRAYLEGIGVPATASPIIGTVGQFRAERQPQSIARILIEVLKQTPDSVHALMCGSGEKLDAVRALVEGEGLASRFSLPGTVNEPRLAMSAMSVYLTINVGSITGVAAIEAAFCGVPIVALQVDSTCSPSDDDLIWSSAAPESLSQRILRLLADPEEREQIAARQHAHAVANYSVDSMLAKYMTLYRRAIGVR